MITPSPSNSHLARVSCDRECLRYTPPMTRSIPFLWSPAWRALRLVALRRDGYRCVICGGDVSAPGRARIDHIVPTRVRPDLRLTLSNTRSLCARCDNQSHREKGGTPTRARTGERVERMGADRNGMPMDPMHHWNR
jgi:5-methylcytosine-specific restriction endonuclease McrA